MTWLASTEALEAELARAREGFTVEPVAWTTGPWAVVDGAVVHPSGGFFAVVGVRRGEDTGVWLYQPQSALTGLLTTVARGERWYLLQTRVEPGTPGGVQLGPTIQSTPANYLKAHGGRATPYLEPFTVWHRGTSPLHDSSQLDLGRRYHFKSKRLIVAHAEAAGVQPGYAWVSAGAIRDSLHRSLFFNIDLRSFFAIIPWDGAAGIAPVDAAVARSAEVPPRPSVVGEVLALLGQAPQPASLVPLDEVAGWRIGPRGLEERTPRQGFRVEQFRVRAPGREVREWTQPLVRADDEGQATLLCRRGAADLLEVLVTVAREPGLATGAALAPSRLRYPGATEPVSVHVDATPGRVLASTAESDEGGRFFHHVSRYELVLHEEAAVAPAPGQVWLSVAELKLFLATSNACTIQLRGLASLLLAARLGERRGATRRVTACGPRPRWTGGPRRTSAGPA